MPKKSHRPVLSQYNHITMNLAPIVRYETLHGREYIVAPVSMMTEGVHNGSNGPLFYSKNDLSKDVVTWNTKPVVVYHPKINGEGVSACDPEILEQQQVGVIMNARYDNKLRCEAWLELDLLEKVDPRVIDALEKGELMEVSTGLFTDNDYSPGTYNGQEYEYVATNHRPDHLAILPDKIGACSIAKGAGLLQMNELADGHPSIDVDRLHRLALADTGQLIANALSYSDTHTALNKAVQKQHGKDTYVVDVYPKYFVYEYDRQLYRQDYKAGKVDAELIGQPDAVTRQVMYRAATGALIGNQATNPKEQTMPKKEEIVDGLIANDATQWSADDREFLLTQNEEQLAKFGPVANKAKGKTKPKADDEMDDDMKGKKGAVQNAAKTGAVEITPQVPVTPEAYIGQAPAPIQNVLNAGLAAYNAEKQRLIGVITANSANAFTAEQLDAKDNPELAALAKLAAPAAPANNHQGVAYNYGGQATPAPTANAAPEDGLAVPAMSFDS